MKIIQFYSILFNRVLKAGTRVQSRARAAGKATSGAAGPGLSFFFRAGFSAFSGLSPHPSSCFDWEEQPKLLPVMHTPNFFRATAGRTSVHALPLSTDDGVEVTAESTPILQVLHAQLLQNQI